MICLSKMRSNSRKRNTLDLGYRVSNPGKQLEEVPKLGHKAEKNIIKVWSHVKKKHFFPI